MPSLLASCTASSTAPVSYTHLNAYAEAEDALNTYFAELDTSLDVQNYPKLVRNRAKVRDFEMCIRDRYTVSASVRRIHCFRPAQYKYCIFQASFQ